ncbi:hypothetical protein DL768_010456 [Monosporascus sp. mg162]|nr:hypothetical protein DL768_010456 [Monosporascus sp. mg162]
MTRYFMVGKVCLWLLALSNSVAAGTVANRSCSLPVVDLGYEIHQAITLDDNGRYNFSNIRYAAAPVGELRFAAPSPPLKNRWTIQIGDEVRICPQAQPNWLNRNIFQGIQHVLGPNGTIPPSFAGATSPLNEDCLFLDIVVPKKVFENASSQKAPVIVWIYGGGFVNGIKSSSNSGLPGGLLDRARNDTVYVALNYRLGAFGFLAGSSFQNVGGVPNAGLLDQRFALDWIQQNIHLFGGDADRVTVIGESAGGGSILYQITAYGGSRGPVPFRRAILQSPGTQPANPESFKEQSFNQFLDVLNVSSLAEARQLPTEILIQANAEYIAGQPTGVLPFLPAHDGDFLPDEPATLLAEGRFDKSVEIIVGSNTNDGVYFGDFEVSTDEEYLQWLRQVYPSIRPEDVDTIATTLYPPIFDGSQGYVDQTGRTARFAQDILFQCNGLALAWAKGNKTFNYEFAYVTSFALIGQPTSPGNLDVPVYGPDGQILVLNATETYMSVDSELQQTRCSERSRILANLAL